MPQVAGLRELDSAERDSEVSGPQNFENSTRLQFVLHLSKRGHHG